MHRHSILTHRTRLAPAARPRQDNGGALKVVIAYEDPLMHHWAMELWDRVGGLVGSAGISRSAWRIRDLAHPDVLAQAVTEAGQAHVLILSLRDSVVLPRALCQWIAGWAPNRISAGGALVAIIGLPPHPNGFCGRAYNYLETVAGQAGLDFLPHERKLPESPGPGPTLPVILPSAGEAQSFVSRA